MVRVLHSRAPNGQQRGLTDAWPGKLARLRLPHCSGKGTQWAAAREAPENRISGALTRRRMVKSGGGARFAHSRSGTMTMRLGAPATGGGGGTWRRIMVAVQRTSA
eukprot:10893715-Alexandrium_andersonii.AAC.1